MSELEITINAAEFEEAVEQFKERLRTFMTYEADRLAFTFRDRLLQSICAQSEGRPVRLTIKTDDAPRAPAVGGRDG